MLPVVLAIIGSAVADRNAAAQSFDLQRFGYDRGDPAAPISIIEFGDFGCSVA
jgi:hypothetical protein